MKACRGGEKQISLLRPSCGTRTSVFRRRLDLHVRRHSSLAAPCLHRLSSRPRTAKTYRRTETKLGFRQKPMPIQRRMADFGWTPNTELSKSTPPSTPPASILKKSCLGAKSKLLSFPFAYMTQGTFLTGGDNGVHSHPPSSVAHNELTKSPALK